MVGFGFLPQNGANVWYKRPQRQCAKGTKAGHKGWVQKCIGWKRCKRQKGWKGWEGSKGWKAPFLPNKPMRNFHHLIFCIVFKQNKLPKKHRNWHGSEYFKYWMCSEWTLRASDSGTVYYISAIPPHVSNSNDKSSGNLPKTLLLNIYSWHHIR